MFGAGPPSGGAPSTASGPLGGALGETITRLAQSAQDLKVIFKFKIGGSQLNRWKFASGRKNINFGFSHKHFILSVLSRALSNK